MKKVLNMQLSSSHIKPVFRLSITKDTSINCMLDTGADMPVWCSRYSISRYRTN